MFVPRGDPELPAWRPVVHAVIFAGPMVIASYEAWSARGKDPGASRQPTTL